MRALVSGQSPWRRFLEDSSFIREYLWKYRVWVAIGLVSLVIVDILEIIPPILLKDAVDVTLAHGSERRLLGIAAVYFVVSVVQGACRYGWRMYLVRASLVSGRDLRSRYAHHLFRLPTSFFDRKPIGDLMSLATSDTEAVRSALGPGTLIFFDALVYFCTVPIAMYWLSPKLTLLAFVPLPVIPWLMMRNEREVHVRFEKVQECMSRLAALTQESLGGIRVVKAFAKERVQLDRFKQVGEEYARLSMRLARVQTAFGPTMDFAMSLGMVLLLFVGGRLIIGVGGDSAGLSLGTFVAFQRFIQKMVWPMAALGMALNYYQRSVTSGDRLKEIFTGRSDVPDREKTGLPASYVPGGAWKTPGKVALRALSFRFPRTERVVLKEISIEIESGERVAFVGAVGAGKSALLSLLPRLYPIGDGMLWVDGVDVNDWPALELRQQLGFVSQDVFLFSETVTENVAYGFASEWRDSVERLANVEQATRLASVHEDILGLTGSYETRLGERGVNLSGGQKQRLSIARALAKQPSILVLDDALSSVDVQTEEKILAGLRARPGRNTEIIAAHRISTIRDADRIVVLGGGSVRQMGTHVELLADRRGDYARYYEEQMLKEDLEAYADRLEPVVT
jgi:ATP-binding cassette subfamily B protein